MSSALLHSMTGFARADGAEGGSRWTWELRSVNGKGLDIRFRGPAGLEALEQGVRERAGARLTRGNVQVGLSVQRETAAAEVRVNREALESILKLIEELRPDGSAPPAIEHLLGIRGVIEVVEAEAVTGADLQPAMLASFESALDQLVAMRSQEGAAIAAMLAERLDAIEELSADARSHPARSPEAIRSRLAEQIDRLLEATSAIDPARLHQEAALLATRADIGEEVDRLDAHVTAARALLAEGGPVGRRLDFLAQEFNRETNTIASKSNDRGITAIGLDLKAVVDQFREQVQNLE